MNKSPAREFVIGISARALFDLQEEAAILESLGPEQFSDYQIAQEETTLDPGTGFNLSRLFLDMNGARKLDHKIVIVVFSPDSPDASLRLFRSIEFHNLGITRVAFTGGEALARYLNAFQIDLFLSTDPEDVQEAFHEGIAAALVRSDTDSRVIGSDRIRFAFDGEAIQYSEESDRIFAEEGAEAFSQYEQENARKPTPDGSYARLFRQFALMQARFEPGNEPIRTALVVAKSGPALERAIRAMRAWEVRLDEAFVLDGAPKRELLGAFQPHLYFDSSPEIEDQVLISEPTKTDKSPNPASSKERAA